MKNAHIRHTIIAAGFVSFILLAGANVRADDEPRISLEFGQDGKWHINISKTGDSLSPFIKRVDSDGKITFSDLNVKADFAKDIISEYPLHIGILKVPSGNTGGLLFAAAPNFNASVKGGIYAVGLNNRTKVKFFVKSCRGNEAFSFPVEKMRDGIKYNEFQKILLTGRDGELEIDLPFGLNERRRYPIAFDNNGSPDTIVAAMLTYDPAEVIGKQIVDSFFSGMTKGVYGTAKKFLDGMDDILSGTPEAIPFRELLSSASEQCKKNTPTPLRPACTHFIDSIVAYEAAKAFSPYLCKRYAG